MEKEIKKRINKTRKERLEIRKQKEKQTNGKLKKYESQLKRENEKIKIRKNKEKGKNYSKNIKTEIDLIKLRERKKKNKIPNQVILNKEHKDTIILNDTSKGYLEVYGKGTYIIYYIFNEKRKKYKKINKIKIEKIKYNKGHILNKINIPKKKLKYIKNKLEEFQINYLIISKRLNYMKLDEKKYADSKFKKIYKIAKKEIRLKEKILKIKENLKNMDKKVLNKIINEIKKIEKI